MKELRVLRRMMDQTQFELSRITGIHASKISLLERGLVEPRPDERERLMAALKIHEGMKAAKRRHENKSFEPTTNI